MLAANPTLLHPALSASSADSFAHPRSVDCQLSAVSSPVSPFVATLTDSSQPIENPATLSPVFVTLTSRVNPNPCVCHSYKKHPGVGCPSFSANSVPSALKFTRALPSTDPFDAPHRPPHCFSSFHQSPVTIHQSQSAKSFIIRTYAKCARNSFRMNTSKTQDLKLFRINTYEKTGGGVPPALDARLEVRRDLMRARSAETRLFPLRRG